MTSNCLLHYSSGASKYKSIRDPLGSSRLLTSLAGIVHEHDLHEQVSGGAVNDAVDGAQQGAPGLIVKDNHNAGVGHVVGIHLCFTADEAEQRQTESNSKQN